MTLTARSSLADVAFAVGAVLRRHRIPAVLTGGACVALHTDGAYVSHDLDFILQGVEAITAARLDDALAELGFRRRGNQYRHPKLDLYIEFPPGPLAIGGDHHVKPVELRRRRQVLRALSPPIHVSIGWRPSITGTTGRACGTRLRSPAGVE